MEDTGAKLKHFRAVPGWQKPAPNAFGVQFGFNYLVCFLPVNRFPRLAQKPNAWLPVFSVVFVSSRQQILQIDSVRPQHYNPR
jgi:hypothetical protein